MVDQTRKTEKERAVKMVGKKDGLYRIQKCQVATMVDPQKLSGEGIFLVGSLTCKASLAPQGSSTCCLQNYLA